jgi:deazaflavin-dependent oxidoreductase (nitroreductase family)
VSDWNTGIIEQFRTNEGKVGPPFEGAPLIILHTTGAKTGEQRLAPLMSLSQDDRLFVFAPKAGADSHPDWLHNLRANPTVTVEAPGETYEAKAIELDEPERSDVYAVQVGVRPQFGVYQESTARIIPVVELIRE